MLIMIYHIANQCDRLFFRIGTPSAASALFCMTVLMSVIMLVVVMIVMVVMVMIVMVVVMMRMLMSMGDHIAVFVRDNVHIQSPFHAAAARKRLHIIAAGAETHLLKF